MKKMSMNENLHFVTNIFNDKSADIVESEKILNSENDPVKKINILKKDIQLLRRKSETLVDVQKSIEQVVARTET
eukprot:UN13296